MKEELPLDPAEETAAAAQAAVMSDDDLLDELREQINYSRNRPSGHDRPLTRAVSVELSRRGLVAGRPVLV